MKDKYMSLYNKIKDLIKRYNLGIIMIIGIKGIKGIIGILVIIVT